MARKVQQAGIYKDAQDLWDVIYEGQFEMCQRDRPIMAVRLLNQTTNVMRYFALSYAQSNPIDKKNHTEAMLGEFEVLKTLIRKAKDKNMFKKEETKNRLTELIVKMDEGIERYHYKLVLNDYTLQ